MANVKTESNTKSTSKNPYTPTADEIAFMKSSVETESKNDADLPWYQAKEFATQTGKEFIKSAIGNAGSMWEAAYNASAKPTEQDFSNPWEVPGPTNFRIPIRQNPLPTKESIGEMIGYEEPITGAGRLGKRLGKNLGDTAIPAAYTAMTGGAGALPMLGYSALGALTGHATKELTGSEGLANAVDIGTQIGPSILTNRIPNVFQTQAAQEERALIANAERFGMTPEEYALTLNQRGPVKDFIQEVSAKGGRTVERFQRTRESLGRVWNTLRNSPEAQTVLGGQNAGRMINDISTQMARLPTAQRNLITGDFQDLLGSNMQGTDLIDFWQKLNYHIARGEGAIGTLKTPIQTAINTISPQFGADFQMTNRLYGNFHRLSERMGPNVAESLIRAGENGIVVNAITTGNYPLLKHVLSAVAARQVATELSTNPRLMNLSSKLLSSINQRLPQVAQHAYDQLILELGKTNAEAAMKMSDMDWNKFIESLPKEKDQK
jgi:hypothetical protein